MFITPQAEITADGSATLRHPVSGETYHSLNGALTESMHVFIKAGLLTYLDSQPNTATINILEVGLGSGLNAFLTARHCGSVKICYTAIEKYPVSPVVTDALTFGDDPFFRSIHECPWERDAPLRENFTIRKVNADLALTDFHTIFDIVYFDAFAPDIQPELWTTGIFRKIYDSMSETGILVTYSSKGIVKQALRQVGFKVSRLPGAPGKRHMVRAIKNNSL